MPATLSILANVFTDERERARAIALWAGVSGLGVAIGPLAGGYLLEHFWWGSIFLVNVPIIVVAAIVGALVSCPNSKDARRARARRRRHVAVDVGLIALLFGIIEGPSEGWTDPLVVGSFAVGGRAADRRSCSGSATPTTRSSTSAFFANPRFTAASIAITFVFFAMFGSLFFVSQYLQFVLGYSALEVRRRRCCRSPRR